MIRIERMKNLIEEKFKVNELKWKNPPLYSMGPRCSGENITQISKY